MNKMKVVMLDDYLEKQKKPTMKTLSFRLSEDRYADLKSMAKQHGLTVSDYLRLLIEAQIKK